VHGKVLKIKDGKGKNQNFVRKVLVFKTLNKFLLILYFK